MSVVGSLLDVVVHTVSTAVEGQAPMSSQRRSLPRGHDASPALRDTAIRVDPAEVQPPSSKSVSTATADRGPSLLVWNDGTRGIVVLAARPRAHPGNGEFGMADCAVPQAAAGWKHAYYVPDPNHNPLDGQLILVDPLAHGQELLHPQRIVGPLMRGDEVEGARLLDRNRVVDHVTGVVICYPEADTDVPALSTVFTRRGGLPPFTADFSSGPAWMDVTVGRGRDEKTGPAFRPAFVRPGLAKGYRFIRVPTGAAERAVRAQLDENATTQILMVPLLRSREVMQPWTMDHGRHDKHHKAAFQMAGMPEADAERLFRKTFGRGHDRDLTTRLGSDDSLVEATGRPVGRDLEGFLDSATLDRSALASLAQNEGNFELGA